jgi:hypothetical protein
MSYLQEALKAVKQDQAAGIETKISLVKKALPATESLWVNPHAQGSPNTRRQSLEEVMDAIVLTVRDRVVEAHKGRQFVSNDLIRHAEDRIEEVQEKVLTGETGLQHYSEAVKSWERLCLTEYANEAIKVIRSK